jgi:hypothetical protein
MGSKFPLPPTLPEISLDLDEPGDDDSGTQPIAEAWDQALDEMHRAARRGDSERALHLGTRYLEQHGTNPSIELFVHELRGLVEARLTRTLALDRVVVLCRPLTEMSDATLDHRAGFLLSRIDGSTTVEELLDLAPIPRLDALRLLAQCLADGTIRFA